MKKGTEPNKMTHRIESPFGAFQATFTNKGLASLNFPDGKKTTAAQAKSAASGESELSAKTEAALLAVLKGVKPKGFPSLDLQGTEFQRAVWKTLAGIPRGKTMTYGEIAQAIGRPKAFRAVGQACGANPIPVLIPCHRALAANRRLGGFSGGTEWKEKLLTIENCAFVKPPGNTRA